MPFTHRIATRMRPPLGCFNSIRKAGLEDSVCKLDEASGIIDDIIEARTRPKVERAVAAFKKRASYKPVVWQTKGAILPKPKAK